MVLKIYQWRVEAGSKPIGLVLWSIPVADESRLHRRRLDGSDSSESNRRRRAIGWLVSLLTRATQHSHVKMPKAKREKKVSLTKTERKGLQWKQHIITDIRRCIEKYRNIFVFHVRNMRNNLLKDLRQEWKQNSRFVFGKNRIMQIALGRTKSEEVNEDLHQLANRLTGQVGLLFTDKSKKYVLEWSRKYWAVEYARSGFIATDTVILPQGPLTEFSHSIEPHLRSLGIPTSLKKGLVTLNSEFTVCEEGEVLTPNQARILKLFANPMAKFELAIVCSWNKTDGFELHVKNDYEGEVASGSCESMEDESSTRELKSCRSQPESPTPRP